MIPATATGPTGKLGEPPPAEGVVVVIDVVEVVVPADVKEVEEMLVEADEVMVVIQMGSPSWPVGEARRKVMAPFKTGCHDNPERSE